MTDRELMQQALGYMESVGQMDMYPEEWAIVVALRDRLAQPEQDVPATCFGNMGPVGWLESPDGAFRANPLYKIQFPSQLLSWQVPLYIDLPDQELVIDCPRCGHCCPQRKEQA